MDGRQPARLRADFADSIDDWMRAYGRPRSALDAASMETPLLTRVAERPRQRQEAPRSDIAALADREPQFGWRNARDQFFAGLRGAQDAFTFGLGDQAYAAGGALWDAYNGQGWRNAYRRRIEREHKSDEEDAVRYPTARTVGQLVGTGAQIAALGPIGGGARMAQVTRLSAKEIGSLAMGGAELGVVNQTIDDLARGRVGSVGDYVGAALGGAAGTALVRGGRAGLAGALGGAATSVAQDLANGRAPSLDRAREAASVGNMLGYVGGVAGRRYANSLPNVEKGKLGEALSEERTKLLRGERVKPGRKTAEYLPGGGHTFPDHRSYDGAKILQIIESKHGPSYLEKGLSRRQEQAYHTLNNYRVDHTLPFDVGMMYGYPTAIFGYQTAPQGERK